MNYKKPSESSDISSGRIEERREKGRERTRLNAGRPFLARIVEKFGSESGESEREWEREGGGGPASIRNFTEEPRTRTTFPSWARDADEKSKIYLPDP